MCRMNWRGQPKSQGSHEEEVAERKERQWRRGTERSGRDLQEARPDNGHEEVNVGSWRCVGRKHQALHPSSHKKQRWDHRGPPKTEKKRTTQVQVSLHFWGTNPSGEEGKEWEGERRAKRQEQRLQEGHQKNLARRGRPEVLWGCGTTLRGLRGWCFGRGQASRRRTEKGSRHPAGRARAGGVRAAGQWAKAGGGGRGGTEKRTPRQGRAGPGGGAWGTRRRWRGRRPRRRGRPLPSLPPPPVHGRLSARRAAVSQAGRPPPLTPGPGRAVSHLSRGWRRSGPQRGRGCRSWSGRGGWVCGRCPPRKMPPLMWARWAAWPGELARASGGAAGRGGGGGGGRGGREAGEGRTGKERGKGRKERREWGRERHRENPSRIGGRERPRRPCPLPLPAASASAGRVPPAPARLRGGDLRPGAEAGERSGVPRLLPCPGDARAGRPAEVPPAPGQGPGWGGFAARRGGSRLRWLPPRPPPPLKHLGLAEVPHDAMGLAGWGATLQQAWHLPPLSWTPRTALF